MNRYSKPEREIRLETQIRNLQTKMLRRKKNAGICWDENRKATQVKQTMQLKEINLKVLAKEVNLKRYREWIKYTDITGNGKTKKNLPASSRRMHEHIPATR